MNLKQLPEYLRAINYYKASKIVPLVSISLLITLTELLSFVLIFPIIQAFLDMESFSQGVFSQLLSSITGIGDKTKLATLLVGILAGIVILRSALSYFGYRWLFSVINKDEARYSTNQFQALLGKDYLTFKQSQSSQIIRDIAISIPLGFSTVLQALLIIFSELIVFSGLALYLLVLNPDFFICILALLAVAALVYNRAIGPVLSTLARRRHELSHKSIGIISESLEGIAEIKKWQGEKFFVDLFDEQRRSQAQITASQMAMQYMPKLYFESIVMIVICLSLGYFLLSGLDVERYLPLLGFYVIVAFRSLPSILRLSAQYNVLISTQPAINVIMNGSRYIAGYQNSMPSLHFSKSIKMRNIFFSYNENKVLGDLSLDLQKGDLVGIAGKSGEGKTTLINIIAGLLKPDSGRIICDDREMNQDFSSSLLSLTGYVSQSTFLLNDTIRSNIAFGIESDQIDDVKVDKAISFAQLDEFVASLPDGKNHKVGERGGLLSGGQRQRLGIARAFYFDRDILILDEVTSSLDKQTERDFIEVLKSLKGLKTVVMVSHKMEPLSICDKVYDMSDGQLVLREGAIA